MRCEHDLTMPCVTILVHQGQSKVVVMTYPNFPVLTNQSDVQEYISVAMP